MAKWSLKNKQNENEVPQMPPELSSYYRAENRDRAWGTWALGFGTLVVTVLLGIGLFMGGKWVLKQFSDEPEVVTTEQSGTKDTTPSQSDSGDNPALETPEEEEQGEEPGEEPASEPEGVVSDEAVSTTNENLPDTGPTETMTVFLAVTVFATLGHSFATKRR